MMLAYWADRALVALTPRQIGGGPGRAVANFIESRRVFTGARFQNVNRALNCTILEPVVEVRRPKLALVMPVETALKLV
jgi:hypothetical protein